MSEKVLLDTNLEATEAAQARAEGWCRPWREASAGGALAHGRGTGTALRGTRLETQANRTSARARTAPKHNPGSGRQWARRRAPACGPRWLNYYWPSRSTRTRTSLTRRPPADGRPAWVVASDANWLNASSRKRASRL